MSQDAVVSVRRDPFARGDVVRKLEVTPRGCTECGQKRKSGKMFVYGWSSDGGRTSWDDKPFCSLNCRDGYYS